jgi:hypothetical protein
LCPYARLLSAYEVDEPRRMKYKTHISHPMMSSDSRHTYEHECFLVPPTLLVESCVLILENFISGIDVGSSQLRGGLQVFPADADKH